MKILQELLSIRVSLKEALDPEIAHLTEILPKAKHKEAISRLLDSGKLSWHGMRIFDAGEETGPAQKLVSDAALRSINQVEHFFDGFQYYFSDNDSYNIEFRFVLSSADSEEVYIGYDRENDLMIVGVETQTDDETFNDGFEVFWQEVIADGKYDADDDGAYEQLRKDVKKMFDQYGLNVYGSVFSIDHDPETGKLTCELADEPTGKGFYRGAINWVRRHPEIIDLVL